MEFNKEFLSLRKSLGLTQGEMATRLGLSSNYVSLLESGSKEPSDAIRRHVELIQRVADAGLGSKSQSQVASYEDYSGVVREDPVPYGRTRMIPVIGWAHAGSAESYEEIPETWQCKVPTECRDAKAFAVSLEGDSMEPRFGDGDLIIVQPSETAYSGCYVVAKFASDGVIFRRVEMSGTTISLVPLNERYPVTSHSPDEFSWIYPVWGRWTQIWKR